MVERMPPGAFAPMPRRLWWLIVLRGLAAFLFGLVAIFWPGVSLAVLVTIIGIYALIDGALTTGLALRLPPEQGRRSLLLVTGISGLAIGLVSVLWPQVTITLLIYLLAAWLVLFGLVAIFHSFALKREFGPDWPVSKGGILLVVIGLLLVLFPNAVAVAATWVIGILALLLGGGLLAFAWRRHQRDSAVI